MTKQDMIDRIQISIDVNRESMAKMAVWAREHNRPDHNIYTELVDFHKGKILAYEDVLEMLEA